MGKGVQLKSGSAFCLARAPAALVLWGNRVAPQVVRMGQCRCVSSSPGFTMKAVPTYSPQGTAAQRADVLAFLNRIGIPCVEVDEVGASFLEGVAIRRGTLAVAPEASIDSILHEAGHLAITPTPFRTWLDGDVGRGQRRMIRAIEALDLEPDAPLMRAVLQSSDPEATAWAWAAGVHLGLPPEIIVLDTSYDGEGAMVRLQLQRLAYIGIHGLCHAGMCQRGMLAQHRGVAPYPALSSWLQEASLPLPQPTRRPTSARM